MRTAAGGDLFAAQFASSGIGPVAGQCCAHPTSLRLSLQSCPIVGGGSGLCARLHGLRAVSWVLRGGNDILVDPLAPDLTVVAHEFDDDLAINVTFAGRLFIAMEDGRSPDHLINLGGNDLFR